MKSYNLAYDFNHLLRILKNCVIGQNKPLKTGKNWLIFTKKNDENYVDFQSGFYRGLVMIFAKGEKFLTTYRAKKIKPGLVIPRNRGLVINFQI